MRAHAHVRACAVRSASLVVASLLVPSVAPVVCLCPPAGAQDAEFDFRDLQEAQHRRTSLQLPTAPHGPLKAGALGLVDRSNR